MVAFSWATIPTTILYQGRVLNFSDQKPVEGQFAANFKVVLYQSSNGTRATTFIKSINNVVVQDGLFSLEIPIEENELLDQVGVAMPLPDFSSPYEIEVLIGDKNRGGLIGRQVFHSVPYAYSAKSASYLNRLGPDGYALVSHSHATPGTAVFEIDASQEAKTNSDQFVIVNSSATTVFKVDQDSKVISMGKIQATSHIVISNNLSTVTTMGGSKFPLQITKNGDFIGNGDISPSLNEVVTKLSVTGALKTSGGYFKPTLNRDPLFTYDYKDTFQTSLLIEDSLTLKRVSTDAVQMVGAENIIANAHNLEGHKLFESQMGANVATLVSKLPLNVFSNGSYKRVWTTQATVFNADHLHTHELSSNSVLEFPTVDGGVIESRHIGDGTLVDADFSSSDKISSSRLGTISKTGAIDLNALPTGNFGVALKTGSNQFLDINRKKGELIVNEFDGIKAKGLSLISNSNVNDVPVTTVLTIRGGGANNSSEMTYKFFSNGEFLLSDNVSLETTRIRLKRTGSMADRFVVTGPAMVIRPPAGEEASFFDGDDIEDGQILGEDFVNGAITTLKFKNFSISDSSFRTGGAGNNQFTFTNTSFKTSTLTSKSFGAGSLTTVAFGVDFETDKLKDLSISGEDFVDSTIKAADFVANSITSDKVCTGLGKCIESSKWAPDTIVSSKFAASAVTGGELSTGTITDVRLAASVLTARTAPMKITTDATFEQHRMFRLNNESSSNPGVFLEMESIDNTGVALSLLNGEGRPYFKIRNDSSFNMGYITGSAGPMYLVTVTTKFLAPLVGVEDKNGNCGNADSDMTRIRNVLSSTSQTTYANCISAQANHGMVPLSYLNAMAVCNSRGYKLCEVSDYLAACQNGKLEKNVAYMTNDLSLNVGPPLNPVMFTNKSWTATPCNTEGDIDVTVTPDTNLNFRCCLKE
jgi:hypothetical protein